MKFIKDTFKQLKRDYGFPVVLYNIVSTDLNLDTGEKRRTLQVRYVNRAILLPVQQYHKDSYNPNDRDLYIDYHDFNIEVGTKVIYDNQHYETIEVNVFERDIAYILKLRAIEGDTSVAPGCASDIITFESTVTVA